MVITDGYAAYDKEYDDAGNKTVMKTYGADGKLIAVAKGYAVVRREYNENKLVIHEAYYDENEQSVMSTDGYASFDK